MTEKASRGLLGDLRRVLLVGLAFLVGVMLLLRLPLVVTGTFVDRSGAAVEHVMVSSRYSWLRFGPRMRGRGPVDARFFAWCLTCGSIHFNFSKDDYLSETVTLYSSHGPHGTTTVDEGTNLFGMLRTVTIHMESIAGAGRMDRFEGRVSLRARHVPVVLSLHEKMRAGALNRLRAQYPALASEPFRYIAFDVARDDDENVMTEPAQHPHRSTSS